MYKIEVIRMGAYVGYLYRRKFLFWWELVDNCIDNDIPYNARIHEWQEKYNIPDKRVRFNLK